MSLATKRCNQARDARKAGMLALSGGILFGLVAVWGWWAVSPWFTPGLDLVGMLLLIGSGHAFRVATYFEISAELHERFR